MRARFYTSGVWTVKQGREEDFVRAWEELAAAVSRAGGAGTVRLLQDHAQAGRFVSFDDWESLEAIEAFRAAPDVEDVLTRMRALVETYETHTLELRAMRS